MPTNIAVIGCGYWGPNLVRNFNQLNNSKVVWVCDLDQSRLDYIKELYPSVKITKDYQEIIQDREIDAACIATPVNSHFKIAKDALLGKKHVLIEKPITSNSKEAEELIRVAKENKRILMVGHTFEYNEAVNKLKDLVNKGELGRMLYVCMTRVNLGVFRDDVNVVWDLCPHDISILNYILNQNPISVVAHGNASYKEGIEDIAFVLLHYPQNIIAHLHVSWLDPCKIRRTVLVGDKKMVVYDDLNDVEPIKIYDKGIIKQPYYETFGDFKLLYNWGDIHSPKIKNIEPLRIECPHFLECIQKGLRPRSDGESGLKVVKVLEAAQQSLKNGGKLININ